MYYSSGESEKILIIGGNVSGLAAASQARRNAPKAEIIVLESGDYISYGTCALPYFISGIVKNADELFVYTPQFFEKERNIRILLNHKVLKLNPQKRELLVQTPDSSKPEAFNYDRLVICSGGSPIDLGIKVSKSINAFFFRNVEDALNLKDFINKNSPKKAVVIGGGSVGLLIAESLIKIGIKVSIIEKSKSILNDFEDEISGILQKIVAAEGIELKLSSELVSVAQDDNRFVKTVSINCGVALESFETDLIILCAGIKANTDFCSQTSIELGKNNAIKTSSKLQTAYSNIYASGDCICVKNIITGKYDHIPTANNAAKTGRIAGENISGGNETFPGSVGTKVDKIFGHEIARTGISMTDAMDLQFNAFKITEHYNSHAKALPGVESITVTVIVDFNTQRILGAQMIGKEGVAKRIDVFAAAITSQMTIDQIYMLDLSYSPGTSTVWDPVNKICGKAKLELLKRRF
jgi:NADPH-dependent 2,4-dienoyl-CoA reductase/sulfur reductase-like enzyme